VGAAGVAGTSSATPTTPAIVTAWRQACVFTWLAGAFPSPKVAEGVTPSRRTRHSARLSIGDTAWTPVWYPEVVLDPDTSELISDAEVADTVYTAFAGTRHEITARLVVRRVKDKNHAAALFPVWRYHAFLTNAALSTVDADVTHRQHAVIETTFADPIDGPLAHLPSGRFNANATCLPSAKPRGS
jgi:hypothetical protein